LIGTTPDDKTQGQVRAVGFSTPFPKPLFQLVNRKYVQPHGPNGGATGISGTYSVGIGAIDGVPKRQPKDGFDLFAGYAPPGQFSYRLELCVKGKWEPVTSPETDHTLAYSEKYQDDLYTVTYGSKQDHPTPQNVLTTVIFAFHQKELEIHVDVKLDCKGIRGVAALSGESVHGYVIDHATGHPALVKNLGVSMVFDDDNKPHIIPQPGHGTLSFPGADPLNPGPGYVDRFPYSHLSKADSDTSSVEINDTSFGVNIGGPCRDFTGAVRALTYDGQGIVAVKSTK
jgi:hypothetical protein